MIQGKDDDLPFDYRQAQYLVPTLSYRDYALAFELFVGLSEHITLRNEYDDSLLFQVQEKDFWGILNTESRTIRYYQVRNKAKVKHCIPMRLIEALRDRFSSTRSALQVGVLDDYVVFADVARGNHQRWPYLRDAATTIAWCKYTLAEEHDEPEGKAFGFVNGLALLKHPALKHSDLLMITCDNQSLFLNNERFEHFEQGPYTTKIDPFSVTIPRFTFARILLRIMRFMRGLCTPYLVLAREGVKIIAPDIAFFVRAA